MEREALLLLLAAALTWLAIVAGAFFVGGRVHRNRGQEPAAWWRLVLPACAGAIVLAFLVGWALREPDPSDERATQVFYGLAVAGALIAGRAVWRAVASVRTAPDPRMPAATVGLVRPRVVVSSAFRGQAADDLLAAALAHEAAHARARDPLRIVVARLCADLQWPLPGARRRLHAWLEALEVRRDEEAVAAGACPIALAEAILVAARLAPVEASGAVAPVAGQEPMLAHRVRRLLDRSAMAPATRAGAVWPRMTWLALLAAGAWLGAVHGESVLAMLPGVIR